MKLPQKPDWMMWDHNNHYHRFLLRHIPSGAKCALDVGSGVGHFATRVAETVPQVVAVDRDAQILDAARTATQNNRVHHMEADIMDGQLPIGSFEFVSCIATLHHMPLKPGLERLRSLLAPGGVLVILGLYKLSTPFDYTYASITSVVDLAVGVVRHKNQPDIRGSGAILVDPRETLREIRETASVILPGVGLRRHMYHRYSLVYSAPAN